MSYNDTEPHSMQYFPQILLGAPSGACQVMSQIHLSTAVTVWGLWRPMKGASAGDGPCGVLSIRGCCLLGRPQCSRGMLRSVQTWIECASPQLCVKKCHLGPKAAVPGTLQPPQEAR